MNHIQLTSELNRLQVHLQDKPRTIISSGFGNGKTTFLKQYMQAHEADTVFVVLHPVNYSCGSNEDVFEYIKRDILLQLAKHNLLTDIDLDAIDASVFTWDNIKELIGFFLSLAPGGERLAKLWDKFQPWIEKGIETKEKYEENKHTFDKFNETFISQRGGIYEHDAYTVLIEKTLESIHSSQAPEGASIACNNTVLVIEDMDRIDPAHMFRILNVLGAHLDEDNDSVNKFGFRNIILVMDYDITKNIFHHFYGKDTNYEGYMNKFISCNIFRFDITSAAHVELIDTLCRRCNVNQEIIKSLPIYTYGSTTVTLGKAIDELSIRDVARILDDLDNQILQDPFLANTSKIESIAPITILMAVLVRLNRRISYNVLCKHISAYPWGLKMLGQYLLHENIFCCGAPFMLSTGAKFAVTGTADENGISNANITEYTGNAVDTNGVEAELNRCFNLARSRVKDCK